MRNPSCPSDTLACLNESMESQKRSVLHDIHVLLKGDTITEVDRNIIVNAVAFIENPTENLPDIMAHMAIVGRVVGDYMVEGIDPPPEIDAVHGYLLALQCANRVNFIEEGLLQGGDDQTEIREALELLTGWAKPLFKGYGNSSFIDIIDRLSANVGTRPE
jgi:hypothetical protein